MEQLLGRREAAEFLGLTPPQKIIDLATGTGTLAYELAKLGHSVIGIDSSKDALIEANKKCSKSIDLHFEQADALNLPYKNGEFDVASISFALHDMTREDSLSVLKEMKRVTKPNGKILIVDHNEPRKNWITRLFYPLIKASEPASYQAFVSYGLDSLLQEAKLTISKKASFLGVVQAVVINR